MLVKMKGLERGKRGGMREARWKEQRQKPNVEGLYLEGKRKRKTKPIKSG